MNRRSPSLVVVLFAFFTALDSQAATATPASDLACVPDPVVRKRDPNAPAKRIAIFFDGTWNKESDRTNVFRLYQAVCAHQQAPENKGKILSWYDPGVGSDFRTGTGGAFGYGFSRNVREGYEVLATHYNPGDRIYVFGFSRGAFTARTFAAMIQQVGVLNRDAYFSKRGGTFDKSAFRNAYEELFKIVKQIGQEESERCGEPFGTWNDIWWRKTSAEAIAALDENRKTAAPGIPARLKTEIEVVGVWDTVAALGRTHGVPEPKYLVTIQDLPGLRRAYQALAIDESRPNFSPIFWRPALAKTGCDEKAKLPSREHWARADSQQVDEAWFPGAHADVGGGYETRDGENLADLSLAWMIGKLGKDELIPASNLAWDPPKTAPVALRHVPKGSKLGVFLLAPGIEGVRDLPKDARIHESVCTRLAAGQDRFEGGDAVTRPYGTCGLFDSRGLRKDLGVVANRGNAADSCARVVATPDCPKRDGEAKAILSAQPNK